MLKQSQNTILLVEDEVNHVKLFERNIRRSGLDDISLHIAGNGREALSFVKTYVDEHGPDGLVVLLDLNLPVMNGLEMLQALRNDALTKNVKVIVLSTSDEKDDLSGTQALGIQNYLVKPINFIQLHDTLTSVFDN